MGIYDIFLEIFIILGYLNQSIMTSSGSGGLLKTEQKHRTQKAAEKANELYCYTCETMDMDPNQKFCKNVTGNEPDLRKKCDEDERICTVKNVSFLSIGENAKSWSLSRSCIDRCQPGCITIGESERLKLRKCVSCCIDNDCNIGNSASKCLRVSAISTFLILLYYQ